MKKKKSLKGMSLIEIIISLAVMALLSMILLTVGTTIDSTKKATNKLKNKIVQQSPYAASRTSLYKDADGNAAWLTPGDINIQIQINRSGSYYDYPEKEDADGNKIPLLDANGNEVKNQNGETVYEKDDQGTPKVYTYNNPKVMIDAKQYNTKDVVNGGPSASKANENLNLKFIDFTPTPAPTPGETPSEEPGEEPEEEPADDGT